MIKAAATLFPVLFLIGLGKLVQIKGWFSQEGKDHAFSLVIKVFFPFLIFRLMMEAKYRIQDVGFVLYILLANILIYWFARHFLPRLTHPYENLSAFLMCTNEGGNIALPLYLSIAGAGSTTVIFDLAIVVFNFFLVPVLMEKLTSTGGLKDILVSLARNTFLIAVVLGLAAHFCGLYDWLCHGPLSSVYSAWASMITAPIIPVILFSLGYDLQMDPSFLKPAFRLMLFRFFAQLCILLGFFVFFSSSMKDPDFFCAVLIYFSCPPSFGLLPMLSPILNTPAKKQFASSFASLYFLVTLAVYIPAVFFLKG